MTLQGKVTLRKKIGVGTEGKDSVIIPKFLNITVLETARISRIVCR